MKRNVYLTGFMCSGKTRVGRLLALRLSMTFLDTDDWIVRKAGKTIPEIFDQLGELHFRTLEKEAIGHAASVEDHVVSLGGGAVMNDDNWHAIQESGETICLSYPPRIIDSRLSRKKDRPLVRQTDQTERMTRIQTLLSQRQSRYREADLVFHLNHEIDAENVADALAGYLGLFR